MVPYGSWPTAAVTLGDPACVSRLPSGVGWRGRGESL